MLNDISTQLPSVTRYRAAWAAVTLLTALFVSGCTSSAGPKPEYQSPTAVSPDFYQTLERIGSVGSLRYTEAGYVEPNYPKAFEMLDEMNRACKSDCGAFQKYLIYTLYARLAYQQGDLAQSQSYYNSILALSPNIVPAFERQTALAAADVSIELGSVSDAQEYLARYSGLTSKTSLEFTFLQASLKRLQHDYEAALSLINQVIAIRGQTRPDGLALRKDYALKLELATALGLAEEQEDARGKLALSEELMWPLKFVAPHYPLQAAQERVEGSCVVRYTVLKNGRTWNVEVVECSDEIFADSSKAAASQLVYEPRTVDGQRVEVDGVEYKYVYQIQ